MVLAGNVAEAVLVGTRYSVGRIRTVAVEVVSAGIRCTAVVVVEVRSLRRVAAVMGFHMDCGS